MNIIIFGPPGAGKGTQANFIVKRYNLFQVSTGKILREEIKNKTEIDYSNSISKSIYLGDIFSDFNGVFSGLSEILDNFDIVIPINDAAYELSFKLKHLATKSQFKHLPEEKNYRLVSDKFLIHKEFYDL